MQNAAVGQNEDEGVSQIYYPGLGGPRSQVIGEEEEKEVMDVLRSKILARDRFDKVRTHFKTRSFEDEFRAYMKCKHALGVSNCTQGLVIALSALGIDPGDEVIVPAYTFIAKAAAPHTRAGCSERSAMRVCSASTTGRSSPPAAEA